MNSTSLMTEPNFSDADAFYAALTDLFRECSDEEAERIKARLILLLANHVGDLEILSEAMEIAGKLEQMGPVNLWSRPMGSNPGHLPQPPAEPWTRRV